MKHFAATVLLLYYLSLTCYAQNSRTESKEQRKEKQYKQIIDLVTSESYQFTGRKANPQQGRQIDLTTRENYLQINGGKAAADMPYFGRAFSAGYGTGGGIVFDGTMESYDVQKNDKKRRIVIKFRIKGANDTYSCTLTISSMESASLSVLSNNRQSISYSGRVARLEKEKE